MASSGRDGKGLAKVGPPAAGPPRAWFDHVLFGSGLLGTIGSVVWYSGWHPNRPWEMAIATGAAAAVMLMGRLHLFDSIKAGGVELHLRKVERVTLQAEQAVEDANQTVQQLKGAIEVLSTISLDSVAMQGFWSSVPLPQRLKAKKDLQQTLEGLGVDRGSIATMVASIDFIAKHMHALKIQKAAQEEIARSEDVSRYPRVQEQLKLLDDWNARHVAPAASFKRVLKDLGVNGAEVTAAVADLEHFEDTGELLRPKHWERAEEGDG